MRHGRPSRRPRATVGVTGGVLLGAALALLLFDPVRLPTRAELRQTDREARTAGDEEGRASTGPASPSVADVPAVTSPASVAEAADRLDDAINAAAASGGIFDEDVTAELLDDTAEVKEAHGIGDAEWFWVEYPDLVEEIETAIADGAVSEGSAPSITQALADLVAAIEGDPLESPAAGDEEDDE